jgi:hypothetical protein
MVIFSPESNKQTSAHNTNYKYAHMHSTELLTKYIIN